MLLIEDRPWSGLWLLKPVRSLSVLHEALVRCIRRVGAVQAEASDDLAEIIENGN
jgi:hypothetical protein